MKFAVTLLVAGGIVLGVVGWPGAHADGDAPAAPDRRKHLEPLKDAPPPSFDVISDVREEYKNYPYPAGWPVLLPGRMNATPVVADFWGDGKLQIVLTCGRPRPTASVRVLHPKISEKPLLFALDTQGKVVPGWPLVLGENPERTGNCSPSVFKRWGNSYLALLLPEGFPAVISPQGKITQLPGKANPTVNLVLADVAKNGDVDVLAGTAACTVDGDAILDWNDDIKDGYVPCVGDAGGDGNIKIFHMHTSNPMSGPGQVRGYDQHGSPIEGEWPQQVDGPTQHPPVMGDILGDGKMQIVGAYGMHLFAWNLDGSPLPNTKTEGKMSSILKSQIYANTASPALADLDGDGKAEIIVFDHMKEAICAWHGDGKPFGKDPNGVIARLGTDECHGVSVVSLGDDGSMDFFTGYYWVRRSPDGKTKVTKMIPGEGSIAWTQPSVVDLYGDGKAEVIFGLLDGRVFIYKTGLAYHPEKAQWPTAQGNFQHTGCWKAAAKK